MLAALPDGAEPGSLLMLIPIGLIVMTALAIGGVAAHWFGVRAIIVSACAPSFLCSIL